jgi:hypothetical protein
LRTHLGIFVVTVAVGQFVFALKTFLCGTNCEDDNATLLDNLQEPDTSSPNPSTSRNRETRDVPESFHVAQDIVLQYMKVLSMVLLPDRYCSTWKCCQWFCCQTGTAVHGSVVSGSVARQVLQYMEVFSVVLLPDRYCSTWKCSQWFRCQTGAPWCQYMPYI